MEENWGYFVWSQELATTSGPKGRHSHLQVTYETYQPLSFFKDFLFLYFCDPKVQLRESSLETWSDITRANWGARPGFDSVWSDFMKKDFRTSPEQRIKADVKRDIVLSPTFSFDDVSPGGLIVLVVKQETFV